MSRKKQVKRNRPGRRLNLFPQDATLGIIIGFGLAYFILVAHPFIHPLHWLYTGIGGLIGYIYVLLWTHRPSWLRQARGRGPWLNYSVPGLFIVLSIVAFVLIGYILPSGKIKTMPPTSFSRQHAESYPGMQVNTEPIPISVQEHIMEHVGDAGPGIIVSYNCQTYQCEPNMVEKLRELVKSYPPQVFLAPFPSMDAKIAVTTLGEVIVLDALNEQTIRKFIDDNLRP